jgi:predicted O-methyltransferase YrrM
VVETLVARDRHTAALIEFNRMVLEDERVENVIVPIRDGLNLIHIK